MDTCIPVLVFLTALSCILWNVVFVSGVLPYPLACLRDATRSAAHVLRPDVHVAYLVRHSREKPGETRQSWPRNFGDMLNVGYQAATSPHHKIAASESAARNFMPPVFLKTYSACRRRRLLSRRPRRQATPGRRLCDHVGALDSQGAARAHPGSPGPSGARGTAARSC